MLLSFKLSSEERLQRNTRKREVSILLGKRGEESVGLDSILSGEVRRSGGQGLIFVSRVDSGHVEMSLIPGCWIYLKAMWLISIKA